MKTRVETLAELRELSPEEEARIERIAIMIVDGGMTEDEAVEATADITEKQGDLFDGEEWMQD